MDWLRHFDKYSAKEQDGLYSFFIMDDYSSYLTHESWSYFKKNKIILFCLSLHFKHLTQPLDMSCYQPFKHYYTWTIDRMVQ